MIYSKVCLLFAFSYLLIVFGRPIDKKRVQTNFNLPSNTLENKDSELWSNGESIRSLKLGQINFLHTTDTHGWLGSHKNQRDYNANWGHFISFVELFKKNRIDSKKQDLLITDTGDKHDGSGLNDATVPNGIESIKIFNEMDYNLWTLGNHEIYNEERVILEYYTTVLSPKFKDKNMASNVDFILKDGTVLPFGNKYIYMETPVNHLRILSLSFFFNFQDNNLRANVTPIIQSLKYPWFQEVLINILKINWT